MADLTHLDLSVDTRGPLFDGTAVRAMAEGAVAVRHGLAENAMTKVKEIFTSLIRVNHGVFLSTILSIDFSRVFQWGGTWTRDIDKPGGGSQRISRTYSMPIEVADPATTTIVTSELAMYAPWLEGTGSRNLTTRFKGYHGYRLAAQALNSEAEFIANDELQPFIQRCR